MRGGARLHRQRLPVMRLSLGPLAVFIFENAQPGLVFRGSLRMRRHKGLGHFSGLGAAIDVVQRPHQRQPRFARFGKPRYRQAADLQRHIAIAARAVGLGQFEAGGNAGGIALHALAQGIQFVVAIPGVTRIADLLIPDGLLRSRRSGGTLGRRAGLAHASRRGQQHRRYRDPKYPMLSQSRFSIASLSPATVPVRAAVPAGNSNTERASRQADSRQGPTAWRTLRTLRCLSRYTRSMGNFMKNV